MNASLAGRSILVVEDEPLILINISEALEAIGIGVYSTQNLETAREMVELYGLSGAVLDHDLGSDDTSTLCKRLAERGVPYLIYSGLPPEHTSCINGWYLAKPATDEQLREALERMILGNDARSSQDGIPA